MFCFGGYGFILGFSRDACASFDKRVLSLVNITTVLLPPLTETWRFEQRFDAPPPSFWLFNQPRHPDRTSSNLFLVSISDLGAEHSGTPAPLFCHRGSVFPEVRDSVFEE